VYILLEWLADYLCFTQKIKYRQRLFGIKTCNKISQNFDKVFLKFIQNGKDGSLMMNTEEPNPFPAAKT
jgi:hypothetical protein